MYTAMSMFKFDFFSLPEHKCSENYCHLPALLSASVILPCFAYAVTTCVELLKYLYLYAFLQSFSLSEEDLILLILYRTQAVVNSAWQDIEVRCVKIFLL